MPDQPYTFYQGHAASGPMLRDRRPALIVLGDLDAARAALEASAVNGDTRTRAIDAARSATREWFADESGRDREEFVVDAVAAAGLLAAPSHLDRLAAWAEGASGRELAITTEDPQPEIKWLIEACPAGVKPLDGDVVEFDSDIQEAARRVLARLEESS